MKKHQVIHLLRRDMLIVLASIVLTILIVRVGLLQHIVTTAQEHYFIGSFIAGIFFTSVFTIAPSSVVLAKLSELASPATVAFWGALGAMIGDAVLFLLVRDVFAEDVRDFLRARHIKRVLSYFHFGFLKWLVPLIGAIIIASPLPDEIGLTMLGLSRARLAFILPLTFLLNFIGILLIGFLAVQI